MTNKLLITFKQKIHGLRLLPASGGCFELSGNGELIYSKLETGRFPNEEAMIEAVSVRLKKKK